MEYEKEEKIVEKEKEEKQNRTERLWRIIAVILSIFLIIILVVWASSAEEFRLAPFLGFLVVIILIFVSLFWGIGWYRKIQELQGKLAGEGKLPPPVTLEQASEIMEEMLRHPRYADYVLGWEDHKIYNAGKDGKSLILAVRLKTAYNQNPYQYFILNMHYPRDRWSYLNQTKYNPAEITRTVNYLAFSPEKEPDTDVIEEENPLTGTRRRVVSTHRQEEKKEEDKKGDFE
jgi:hypothetical protein